MTVVNGGVERAEGGVWDGYSYWGVLPPPITQTTKGPATDGCGPCEPPGCDARRTRTQCEGVQNQIEPYGMGLEWWGGGGGWLKDGFWVLRSVE